MFCKNCGSEIKSGAFCPSCGTKIEESVNVEATQVEQPVEVVAQQNTNNNSNTNFNATSDEMSTKSKTAAGLFGIFLGAFGVHNFYLGYTGKAVAQLLITVLSCFILSPVSAIWGLIEGIMVLASEDARDAQGKKLVG